MVDSEDGIRYPGRGGEERHCRQKEEHRQGVEAEKCRGHQVWLWPECRKAADDLEAGDEE